jgi:hypothetical protein
VNSLEIAFRAPWYERERHGVTVNDARSLRPVLQKYDKTDFVKRLVADPQDSLQFTSDDHWSYPVPVTFPAPGKGRQRFATSRLVKTPLRKLYQPAHDRFYAVVVELFCNAPGLPRAGKHGDVTVRFVLRRRNTSVRGKKAHVQQLARDLMLNLLAVQEPGTVFDDVQNGDTDDVKSYKEGRIGDREDLWWADKLARERFVEDHKDLLHAVTAHTSDQAWLVDSKTGTGRWADLNAQRLTTETEQTLSMWRLPRDLCDPDWTRSLWFGVVPTYSSEHWNDPTLPQADKSVPKLDERAVYEIVCIATQAPAPGHEHCPPKTWESAASERFRLAAPYDPDGTKNRRVTISAPDLRQLAARAGRPAGPGGLSIFTPPGSQFKFNPFDKSFPNMGGSLGAGGGACTFAFELFFLVALFLFLMFLPIVVFAFQLWWLLALRFCFPRLSVAMSVLAGFFAGVNVMSNADASAVTNLDLVLGDGMGEKLVAAATGPNPPFRNDADTAQALVAMIDPADAVTPSPEPELPHVPDPLCLKK